MAKDPAFLFYTGDFSTGTQFLSDEQLGKFLRLLMAQHQHGHLTEQQVLFICKTHDNVILKKLSKDDAGMYFNVRLESEILKRKTYSLSRSDNRKGKNEKKTKKRKPKDTSSSYDEHMENKNKDKNINKDLIENREQEFLKGLKIFVTQYSIEMLKEFHRYWSEKSKNGKKMRFEMQDTWELSKRLASWKSRSEKNFKNNGNTRQSARDERGIDTDNKFARERDAEIERMEREAKG